MLVELMPLAGVVGAMLGAAVTYWLTRSRLLVTVGRTSISSSEWASDSPVPNDSKLKQEVISSPHNLPFQPEISLPERMYVSYLKRLDQALEDYDASDRTAAETAERLAALAVAEDFERMIEGYKFSQQDLWLWAEAEVRRGTAFFSSPWTPTEEEEESVKARYFERTNEDGLAAGYLIGLAGPVNLGFQWKISRSPQQTALSQDFAARVAAAFIHRKKSDLVAYFQGVRTAVDATISDTKRLRELVQQELEQFSRIQIDLLVSNPGRTGVSIDDRAAIKLDMKNYPSTSSNGGAGKIPGDLNIGMIAVAGDRVKDAQALARKGGRQEAAWRGGSEPIVLPPGSTMRVIAYSEELLSAHSEAATLKKAYSGAERKMQVMLARFRQPAFFKRGNDDTLRTVRSRKVHFRDSTGPKK